MAEVKPAVTVVDTLLRGVGQVMFQNNPITGLLFLAGIGINSYKYSLTVLLGLVVATLAAYLLGADRTLIRNGLFGFNGVLTGIALSVFLQWDCDNRRVHRRYFGSVAMRSRRPVPCSLLQEPPRGVCGTRRDSFRCRPEYVGTRHEARHPEFEAVT